MNFLHKTSVSDEFIWDVINSHCTQRRRGTGGTAFTINCPMCLSMGQTADKSHRCGVFHSDGIGVHCFNCHFKAKYVIGERLSQNMRKFLVQIGVSDLDIKQIAFQAHRLLQYSETVKQITPEFRLPVFEPMALPTGSQTIQSWHDMNCQDSNYLAVVDYLLSRGDAVATAVPYYWTPDVKHKLNRKLIIPAYHDNHLVGWTARCIDNGKPKYYSSMPKHFLFNSKALSHPCRKYVLVVEGIFDALAVDGVAVMGSDLNEQQIRWLKQCGKTVVVIPDRDHAGQNLTKAAIRQEWAVAIPNYGGRCWWDDDIKDVDAAVARHGRLFTVRSILASMTDNPAQIVQRSNYSI
jgi:hypothetical protein